MNTRPRYYRRDGTPHRDVLEWAKDFETADRRVAFNVLPDGREVSTVFLGMDHNYGEGPPLIFETMVFERQKLGRSSEPFLDELGNDIYCERYSTEAEAREGHLRIYTKMSGEQCLRR